MTPTRERKLTSTGFGSLLAGFARGQATKYRFAVTLFEAVVASHDSPAVTARYSGRLPADPPSAKVLDKIHSAVIAELLDDTDVDDGMYWVWVELITDHLNASCEAATPYIGQDAVVKLILTHLWRLDPKAVDLVAHQVQHTDTAFTSLAYVARLLRRYTRPATRDLIIACAAAWPDNQTVGDLGTLERTAAALAAARPSDSEAQIALRLIADRTPLIPEQLVTTAQLLGGG